MWLIIRGTPCHPEYPDSIVRVPPSHQKGCSHNFTCYDKCIGLLKGTLTDQADPASELGTGIVGGERFLLQLRFWWAWLQEDADSSLAPGMASTTLRGAAAQLVLLG